MISDDDHLIRLGGDEFILIINNITDKERFELLLKDIIDLASQAIRYKDNELFITLSIGIAFTPNDSNSSDRLLSYSDIAMYEAKKFGKNRFVYYSDVK